MSGNPALQVRRVGPALTPDSSRVLLRPFSHGGEDRTRQVIERALSIPEETAARLVVELTADFGPRHHRLAERFLERFDTVAAGSAELRADPSLTRSRRLLIGAYFLAEYSLESTALFNPSIVPHPCQAGLPPGQMRIVLSLRATGEGHISSMTFRTGVIGGADEVDIMPPAGFLTEPDQVPNPRYETALFARTLLEVGVRGDFAAEVTSRLGECFGLDELRACIGAVERSRSESSGMLEEDREAAKGMWLLARSNHDAQFEDGQCLSQRVLFPATASQRNGIEDARFVRFRNADGSHVYFATFTAYDGRVVVPELVETPDFLRFRFSTLNGPAARNKGMALFPRKIGGRYAMLTRQDGESLYLTLSSNVRFWNESTPLLRPEFPWEAVQIGNCGSPMETEAGWLVLSHGVGPLRNYCIGAFLLDLEDPSRVIGRLTEPLIAPSPGEREGYVPNVVYTCGGMVHDGMLLIPYGLADRSTVFATIPVEEVLAAMRVQ